MNVLIFTTLDYKTPCAAKQRLSRLSASLDAFGHNTYLAYSTSDPVNSPFLIDNRNLVFTLPAGFGFSLLHKNHQQVLIFCENIDLVVSNLSIDLVILYSTYSDVIEPINAACKRLDIPLVMDGGEFYSLNPNNILNFTNYLQYRAKLFSYPKVTAMICCSPRQLRYAKYHNIPSVLVPAFTPLTRPNNSKRLPSLNSQFNVLLLASLTPRESPLAIIRAVIAARRSGINIHLNIVGRFNSGLIQKITYLRLKSLIDRHHFIHLHGFLNTKDFDSIISESNCCVIIRSNSKESTHAFPTRIPEIINNRIPLILSNTEPFNLFFTHRKDALLVSYESAAADLASAFSLLASNSELSLDLVDNATLLAEREFSPIVLGRRLSNLLSSLVVS